MAYDEKTGDSHIAAVPDSSPRGSIHDIQDEKLAGAHVFDVEATNITGDIPLHHHPVGPNSVFDDLKEELESKDEVIDWYKPFPLVPGARQEDHILTVRAIVVGIVLGSLTICSNVYLGICSFSSCISQLGLTILRFEDGYYFQFQSVWRCFRLWYRQDVREEFR